MTPPLTPSRVTQARIALALRRRLGGLARLDRADPDTREARAAERLAAALDHAAARSPYYRQRVAPGASSGPLSAWPVVDKADLVGSFDELVTDRGLRRADLEARLARDADTEGDEPGRRRAVPTRRGRAERYRLAMSSGTSGMPGILAFDEREWVGLIANAARARALAGPGPRGPARSAKVGSPSRWHLSTQVPATLADPRAPSLALDAARPIDRIVDELNAWKPAVLSAYPSVLRHLLAAGQAGSLHVAPERVFSSGEYLSSATRQLARSVWGVEIFDQYVATEAGFVASQCPTHDGLHVLDEHVVVEVVDDRGEPCAPGQTGTVLVTVLDARTVPLIRYRIGDRAALAAGPCACGRAGPRLTSVEGSDREMLWLRAAPGSADAGDDGMVGVHPVTVTAELDRQPVGSWIVHHRPDVLRVRIAAPGPAFDPDTLRADLGAALTRAGADPTIAIRVEHVESIPTGPGGKASRFGPLGEDSGVTGL